MLEMEGRKGRYGIVVGLRILLFGGQLFCIID
jgi:hypothetical protein